MHPLHPIFALLIYAIAFATAYLIRPKNLVEANSSRYQSIDGLRGFLALGVFVHHASIWHQYLQIGKWEFPKSKLYNHFGETSVALFFMITSFLFVSKLLNNRKIKFNWRSFFIARFFRMAPVYYVFLAIIVSCTFIISHGQLKTDFALFAFNTMQWGAFAIVRPMINDSIYTGLMGGSAWSLPYEWLFYFGLPLISLLILRVRPTFWAIILSLVFIYYFYTIHGIYEYYMYSFLGGTLAAFVIQFKTLLPFLQHKWTGLVLVLCACSIPQFETSKDIGCLLVIFVFFTIIAAGNTLFGILKNKTLQFLGDICYSTYLLHGLLLFTVFYFGFGFTAGKNLSPFVYCTVILALTPLLIFISYVSYKWIEKPNIERAKRINKQLDALFKPKIAE